ncbi:MAG: isopentenyl-diphosphate Delta-isomerase [Candidatus Nomurabacteria bacterium]|jgi:isopentenyl-diphosphate delta-isomerase|nr:isopentenyl-diphosphate Delta-isomerase [Candidatus Nomurabacteria bacterium]
MEEIILVDEKDKQMGSGEKLQVHKDGKLHRAFSIYVFNSRGELLVQKRHPLKYHSGNLWANTCCSHPRVGESLDHAVHRRLKEEMGFDCELAEKTEFIYEVKFENGLSEHEYLHVYIGQFDGDPIPNKDEVVDYKWISLEDLEKDIAKNEDVYAYWLKVTMMDKIFKTATQDKKAA